MGNDRIFDTFAESVVWWERRRTLYNVVLLLVTIVIFSLPAARGPISGELEEVMIFLIIAANVLYCSTWFIDLFVQMIEGQKGWFRNRWFIFTPYLLFSSCLAGLISWDLFINCLLDQ